jgi:bifunctional non-homologous end joining protein LigD
MDQARPPGVGKDQPASAGWTPPPAGLRPMLAVPVTQLPTEAGWSFEPKWDGYRGIATIAGGRAAIASRRGLDMAAWFAELHGLAGALGSHQAVLDGEVVALDAAGRPDFTALQQRMRARGRPARRAAGTVPVVFMVFDLLWLDGRLLIGRSWAERRAQLEALGLGDPAWQTTPSFVDQGDQMLKATREQGLEGVLAKRLGSPYRPGRRHADWRKLAHEQQAAFLVGGYLPGPAGVVERLLVGALEPGGRLRHVASVEAGLVPAARRRLAERLAALRTDATPFAGPVTGGRWGGRPAAEARPVWVRPELAVLVAYRGWEAGQLRHPRYAGLARARSR